MRGTKGNLPAAVARRGHRHSMAAAEHCEASKTALQQNRVRLRSCGQAVRRKRQCLEHGGLSETAVKRVLAVYILSSGDTCQRCCEQTSTSPPRTLVRWLFVEADLNDLLCMHDEANRSWAMAMKRARMFLAAHEVWRWVHVQNLVHGVAPSAAEVFDRFESRHSLAHSKWVAA